MKKLLIGTMLLLASTVTQAKEGAYVKAAIGLNHINKTYHKDSLYSGELKLKRYFPVVGLGAGYEFSNDVRIETMVDYYFLFSQAERSTMGDMKFKLNLDTKISDWVVNFYKGFPINDKFKYFCGLGLGIASIQDEGTGYVSQDGVDTVLVPAYGKHVYRFTHRLVTGIEYRLYECLYGELSYNYLLLGSNKPQKIDGVDNILKRKFKVHNITLGLRLAL